MGSTDEKDAEVAGRRMGIEECFYTDMEIDQFTCTLNSQEGIDISWVVFIHNSMDEYVFL